MSLTLSITPSITLPPLAGVETAAKEKLAGLVKLIDETLVLLNARLTELGVTEDEIRVLIEKNPKIVDQQIRGKIQTIARYKREAATYSGLVASYNAVAEKISAGETASMFSITQRPLGRTSVKAQAKIVDKDLLVLRNAGLLG